MAHGLETRVPFLDNDLVDFAMRVPVGLKLGNLSQVVSEDENEIQKYMVRSKDGKLLLRQAMEKYIPREVTEREKQGFSSPDASWFKGDSIEYVKDRLLRPNARIYDYMDRKMVNELIMSHIQGEQNRRLLVWSLLSFEEWCCQFL